ncbi:hypothetical protein [Hymenobacter terricola]|uniref:hypothetical protein n=1 Tax=Hymenobacter terricola TaxID=2819236 RepID=UPI001B30D659|nr:hypothetical protein [Hymenobacter terricola]
MSYLLPARFSVLSLLSAALLLSGCCANNVCDCDDAKADAVELRFDPLFLTSDLDTVLIKRYPKDFNATTIPETVTLIRNTAHARDSVLLNNNSPFAQVGTTKINSYRYVVQYYVQQPGSKPVATTALVIDKIDLQGSFQGDGCCTCYTNSRKIVYAMGSVFDLTGQSRPIITIPR